MTNEYAKFLENYKSLFKKYKKETGKLPIQDGELTGEFQEYKQDLEETEYWEKECDKWFGV